MLSKVAAMSSGRLTVATGMPVAWRRSQAARPDGPDNRATARASTSPNGAWPAALAAASCRRSRQSGLAGSAYRASSP